MYMDCVLYHIMAARMGSAVPACSTHSAADAFVQNSPGLSMETPASGV